MPALTPLALPADWATFVDRVALGSDPTDVAAALGYEGPKRAAADLMRHPQVRKALLEATEARLEGVLLPLALDAATAILQDTDAPKAVRAKLALGIIDRVRKKPDKDQAVNPSDLGKDQLQQLVAQLQASGIRPGEMLNVTPKSKGDAEE